MNDSLRKITLGDRLAFAFFGAISSFITGSVIYVFVVHVMTDLQGGFLPAFYPVLIFTACMSALGFITANDYLFKMLLGLWRAIINLW